MKIDKELLEHSYQTTKDFLGDKDLSRLAYLSDHIFEIVTYDDNMAELFATKALEVSTAISDGSTFEYIKNPDNYRWYLCLLNIKFFERRTTWGTSIRGAWWEHHKSLTLSSSGLWQGEDSVDEPVQFETDAEWVDFIRAMVEFVKEST